MNAIKLKIRILESALKKNPAIFEGMEIAEDYQPQAGDSATFSTDYSNPRKLREDVLAEIISLLQLITGDSSSTEGLTAISWFRRADNLVLPLSSLGLRDEALQICTIAHNVVRQLCESNTNPI